MMKKNQKEYWSKITKIPQTQFQKSYLKNSNEKYKKEGYQGCINIRYYDVPTARKIESVAKMFMERYK